MKEFACASVVEGCDATFSAETEEDLMGQIADHARDEHGMDEVPPEVVAKVQANIQES